MTFSVNSHILFVIVAGIILVVLGQSVFFLTRAVKRAKALGIEQRTIKKTISSAAIFTIAPAVAIVVGIIALSKSLGLALPWLRLSVVGSITYETVAAGNALAAAGMDAGTTITDPSLFVTVAWVMTCGITIGICMVPFVTKKIHTGMAKVALKDKAWSAILNDALFLGMISAFLGYVFSDVSDVLGGSFAGLIPVCVMVVSAIIMAICGLISKKTQVRWITDYALPLSMIGGMASAILFTQWLS